MKKWRCTVCGYIHEGDEPPEKCPVCGADKSKFEELTAESATGTDATTGDTDGTSGTQADDPRQVDLGPAPKTGVGRIYQFAMGQMLKHHAHPVSTHVPNGVLPVSFLFILIAAVTGVISVGTAAFCNMVFVVLALPFVLFSGYIEWQKRYQGLWSGLFVVKIIAALVVTLTSVLLVIWWIVNPDVLNASSANRIGFIALGFIMLIAAGIAGFIGGKLVFRD